MRHKDWVLFLLFFCAVTASAALTLHVQSPWRDDGSKAGFLLHVLGAAGGGYNPSFGAASTTAMTDEGDGWYSYTWDKSVSDFQDWESFTISIYPNTADNNYNNNNGTAWKEGGEFRMGTLFGTDTEVWLYTNTADLSYEKSFVAPGSKMVWFKSPWGNKALPQMVLGTDSVLMRFVFDDESSCGWFYGAVTPAMLKRNPLAGVHFIRYKTPYMAVPAEGQLELGTYLGMSDTLFIDGTDASLPVDTKIGALGTCFDSTRVLHVYHPWRNNSTFKDSAVYISIGNNILNNPVAMTADEGFPFWWHYDFEAATVASANWNSGSALFNIYRRQNEWPQVTYFSEPQRPVASSLFPTGVYEAWLHTRSNGGYDLLFSPLEPKTVRLMSPWDNMSPSMIVADDTVRMGPIAANPYDTTQSDTCGWYQGTFYKHTDSWDVQFKQSFGMEYYSLEGIMPEDKGYGTPISLDSMMALYDTVWVYPYPLSSSGPRFSEVFPGRLGICPTMQISAMILDWAGESYADSIDIDFGGIYGGNPYTTVSVLDSTGTLQEYKTCGGHVLNMVQDTLSVYGLPLRVDSLVFPWHQCSAGREIDKWFIPETLVVKDDKVYTNATCRDIDLKLDAEGFWLADVTESPNGCNDPVNPGFYPIDDFQYLDSAKTIPNPKFDWDIQGCKHNYSFAMKINAQFRYVKGQYFEFRGDDDVWVFIDNRLVVDIGGCHSPVEGAVDLDTLGLVEGKEYPFQIFFSERNATGSNFKMRTSINLQTQKTYFPVEKMNSKGIIEYELLQLLIDESLSCDVSSVSKIDTTYAQSVFRLVGGSLPADGVLLEPGLNYGGIYISENMAGFAVDTSAFVNSRTLAPGKYTLICMLASDQNQYQMISFTVPEYPLPDIGFVNVFHLGDSLLMDSKGLTLRGDSLKSEGGKNDTLLAHVMYPDTVPLKVAVLYGTTPCGEMDASSQVNCVVEMNLKTLFPLGFLDKDGQRITTLVTDSSGYATFYVVADSAMVNGFFTIEGDAVNNSLQWTDIHFKEPPVPFANRAKMYDVNGDGIPDSLAVPFSKPFDDVVPDTLAWIFGGTESHKTAGMDKVWPLVFKDSIIVLQDPKGLRKDVFTGIADEVYSGSFQYHYTYTDEDSGEEVKLSMNTSIEDKVAPIILNATIETVTDEISKVVLNLSEGTDNRDIDGASAFVFYRDTLNFMDSLVIVGTDFNSQGNVARIHFRRSSSGALPAVGDYVRLVPGEFTDRSGNAAHPDNPKVRIVGEQRTEVKSPGVVTIGPDEEPWPYDEAIAPMVVPTNKSVEDIIDSLGKPGLLMTFNIGELATSMIMDLPSDADRDSALALVKIRWDGYYYSHLGNFVNMAGGTIQCNDSTVFHNPADPEKSNCYDNPGNIFFEWNGRSENGRLVGTGAYIAKMKVKITSAGDKVGASDDTYTMGIRRSKK